MESFISDHNSPLTRRQSLIDLKYIVWPGKQVFFNCFLIFACAFGDQKALQTYFYFKNSWCSWQMTAAKYPRYFTTGRLKIFEPWELDCKILFKGNLIRPDWLKVAVWLRETWALQLFLNFCLCSLLLKVIFRIFLESS